MRIEVENAALTRALRVIEGVVRENGGYVAPDLIVRERGGEFSCAIGSRFGEPGRVLVSYDDTCRVPMREIVWRGDSDLLEPVAGLSGLSSAQRALLDAWLELVNGVGKVAMIRAAMPRVAVISPEIRQHLAEAGYPDMLRSAAEVDAARILLDWHSAGRAAPAGAGKHRDLIPLKHLVNHHPSGADQRPLPGRTAVVTSATSDEAQTYERYGDLDALQLLMGFGYVDDAAPIVHSVPLAVESAAVGMVRVQGRPGREASTVSRRGLPELRTSPDGVDLADLTFRPDNRPQMVAFLAVPYLRQGVPAQAATRAAEELLDTLVAGNCTFYRRLDDLVSAALQAPQEERPGQGPPSGLVGQATVLTMIASVSRAQQERLATMWT